MRPGGKWPELATLPDQVSRSLRVTAYFSELRIPASALRNHTWFIPQMIALDRIAAAVRRRVMLRLRRLPHTRS